MIYQLMVTITEKPSETTSACAKIAYNNSLSVSIVFISGRDEPLSLPNTITEAHGVCVYESQRHVHTVLTALILFLLLLFSVLAND